MVGLGEVKGSYGSVIDDVGGRRMNVHSRSDGGGLLERPAVFHKGSSIVEA